MGYEISFNKAMDELRGLAEFTEICRFAPGRGLRSKS